MKSFILAAVASSAMALSEIESAFLGYITEQGKSYSTVAEYEMRLRTFAVKHAYIQEHNKLGESYKLGHNKFSDWTDEEYSSILTYQPGMYNITGTFDETVEAASPVDWRNSGCMSPIQDQGQCGSCWAFSSVSALESNYCIANGSLLKLSEQQLVDCVKLCFGCNGGNQSLAFNYYKDHYAMSEAAYPYTAKDGTCQYSSSNNTGVKTTGWVAVTSDSPDAMKAALVNNPMSVSIQANQLSFQLYTSGIFTNTNCGTNLDHATNVVGWGTSNGMDYWIMRNSWGTSWGMSGYMELEIVSGPGLCGIQMGPLYPIAN
jgi:KDEL-tailed cysteine endopeptidase